MRSPVPDYLAQTLDQCSGNLAGSPADYIPELARVELDRFGVALATIDGVVHVAGDADTPFTIQSISKPFAYALALTDCGFAAVEEKVGVEPSGDAFNELSLEEGTGRPLNPMINAGAITAHSLVGGPGVTGDARDARMLAGLSAFAGRDLCVDEAVFASEVSTAYRNLSLAYMLRDQGILADHVARLVEGYTRQCAVVVTARDLALMAATLANAGVQPVTGEQVVSAKVARQVLSVMTTCGMYDAAGDWVTTVGIPAKSGVGGGLIGALPGQLGVATFSPRLDKHGHSVRGVEMFNRLSSDMGLHLMELAPPSASVLRKVRTFYDNGRSTIVFQLQGSLGFTTAERVVSAVVETDPQTERVVFDIERITSIATPGRVMLMEVIRRLADNGHEVLLLDPHNVLPSAHTDQSGVVRVVQTRKELQDG